MHSPKKMLQIIGKKSEYGALPLIEKRGLRDCQYRAEVKFEESLKMGNKKNLAVLATGSGKTYLACLAAYRLLNYTPTKRILFLVDRNNLARQTESEFSVFDRTEGQQKMGNLYTINRLKKEEDIKGDIVISTIQKLFCVLTGQEINDSDEDAEDEKAKADEEKDSKTVVDLGNDLKLPPDYFQLIIVDECHRSIYGKWKKVLDYFSGATVIGLTATPTPEAYAYFNKNVIEEYTYDDSVVDGVNVPPRVYRIITDITAHGGTIEKGTKITETSKRTGKSEIIDAAIKANIWEYIQGLPDGLDTYVGERGVKLSGGQKQRISIARAFLKNPPILILDEATSALDNVTEMQIQKALENLSRGRTTLVVAHRLSTVKNADNIIVIDKSGIIEQGNHNELIKKNGVYANLYQYQFKD